MYLSRIVGETAKNSVLSLQHEHLHELDLLPKTVFTESGPRPDIKTLNPLVLQRKNTSSEQGNFVVTSDGYQYIIVHTLWELG
jgi:hypothetical protein